MSRPNESQRSEKPIAENTCSNLLAQLKRMAGNRSIAARRAERRRRRRSEMAFEMLESRQLLASTVDAPLPADHVGIQKFHIDAGGVLHGRLFQDDNGDGHRNGGEPWLSNWAVFGDRNGDQLLDKTEQRTITDRNGYFSLGGVDALTNVTPLINSSAGSLGNVTPEALVNTNTRYAQMFSDVAVYDSGSVVVWSSWRGDGDGWGVFGQRFDAAGQKVGGEFQVNTQTNSFQMKPSVTAFDDGHFFVVWQSLHQDPNHRWSGWGIYGQRFGADGRRLGGEVRLNQTTYGNQYQPVIQKLANRNLAVAWQGFGKISDGKWGHGIIARTFNGNLQPLSDEARISHTNFGNDQQFDLAPTPDGGFVVAFQGSAKPDYNGIYVRRLTNRLRANGPAMWLVNQFRRDARQWQPAVDVNSQGKIVVTWTSDTGDGSGKAVYAQLMNPDFSLPYGPTLVAEKWGGTQWRSDVKWVGDETFVVSWQGKGGNDANGVFGRAFNHHGVPLGSELRLSDSRSGQQVYGSIDVGNDRLVAAWHGRGYGDYLGIYSRVINIDRMNRGSGSISGRVFDDRNGNGMQDGGLIRGTEPDVVFIVDVSGSTSGQFQGGSVGDRNNDGLSNTILDGEIAGFEALIDELIRQGLGDIADVSVVTFSSGANTLVDGLKPNTDADNNGVSDIKDALRQTRDTGTTNFPAALNQALNVLMAMGTSPENGNVIFISDGMNNGGSFTDEVTAIRAAANNVRAFGVGTGASLPELQDIDPMAQIFTTTDELLNAFGSLGIGTGGTGTGGGGMMNGAEPGLPNVLVYLDRNNNGRLDAGEVSTRTMADDPATAANEAGQYIFTDLPAGDYVVRVVTGADQRVSTPLDEFFAEMLDEDEMVTGLDFGIAPNGTAAVA